MKLREARHAALSRRAFLQQAAGTSLALGAGALLSACGGGSDAAEEARGGETRSYFFDLSGADPQSDHFLVAGSTHHPLVRMDAARLARARAEQPAFASLGDASLTHVGEALRLPAKGPQICYVKSVPKGGTGWAMHSIVYHLPKAAVARAAAASSKRALSCAIVPPQSLRHAFLRPAGLATTADAVDYCDEAAYADYKDAFDHAIALVLNHPEICSFETSTLAYVQSLVCAAPSIVDLAAALVSQGPATTTGGWATLVPVLDDAGVPRLASDGVTPLYFTQHSDTTLQLTGVVIHAVLPILKNDPSLGANITGLTAAQANTGLQGKAWLVRNGTPTRRAAPGSTLAAAAVRLSSALGVRAGAAVVVSAGFVALDLSSGNGFRFTNVSGDATARTVTVTAENWYSRYLGLYVRFLDAAGDPLPLSGFSAADLAQFPAASLNGTYDAFSAVLNQELVILGIPIQQASTTFTINVPASAATVRLLAGGMGVGGNDYPDTLTPGVAMTAAFDLALPGLFLAMAAAQGYGTLTQKMSGLAPGFLVNVVKTLVIAFTDIAVGKFDSDPKLFNNVLISLGKTLLSTAVGVGKLISESLAEGEATGVAEDVLPFGIGVLIQAVIAATLAVQIEQTSMEVGTSPRTYSTDVTLSHDLVVTIHPDPRDTAGFPATATQYRLTAVCDSGSPYDSGVLAMPGTTQSAPLAYTFAGLPSGGTVNVIVTFTSADGWLAGVGTTGPVDNTLDTATITIQEQLVPLSASTVYGHKQKTVLDSGGQHAWLATAVPPPAQPPNPGNQPGSLLALVGITLSEPFGAVGYSWQAYSDSVTSYTGNNVKGQLHQFASMSFGQSPEAGYRFSGKGFPAPARLAYNRTGTRGQNYYIDTSTGGFIVRQIRLNGVDAPPDFDTPPSGLAVGQFNFASDAFFVHSSGKLVSFNSELSKMEVLVAPADPPVADALAPLALALSGPGNRDGLMNGPVCAADAQGTILVLEQANNRIQALDTGANPTLYFAGGTATTMQLQVPADGSAPVYLDLAVEATGFLYVLSQDPATTLFGLDIYSPGGQWLNRTVGVAANKLAIDLFRNVYTLNMETLVPATLVTEPSVSQWVPSTP